MFVFLRGTSLCGNGIYNLPWPREGDLQEFARNSFLLCAGAGFHIYHGNTG